MVHAVFDGMVGIELEGAAGDCDGKYQGKRYFHTPEKCGIVVPMKNVTRILRMGLANRFHPHMHDIRPGDVIFVDKNIGMGIVRWSSAYMIGLELNAAVGDSDGVYQKKRYFKVKPNCAMFISPNKKIYEKLLHKIY
eukprot:UN24767